MIIEKELFVMMIEKNYQFSMVGLIHTLSRDVHLYIKLLDKQTVDKVSAQIVNCFEK